MTTTSTWKPIANDLDAERGYLLRRCLKAEGKDPDDREAMVGLVTDAEDYTRA